MTEKIFIDGLNVDTVTTKFGEIIKLGVKTLKFAEFASEHENDRGYINIDILTNKDGKKYAVLNTYKKPANSEISEDEIPF